MFNEEELKQYQNEFENIHENVNLDEMKSILDFMYSIGTIAYEVY